MNFRSFALFLVAISTNTQSSNAKAKRATPRHCRGEVKHLHIAVGKDPTSEMTISFASKWSNPDAGEAPLAGVHIGLQPHQLDRFVGEQEAPLMYTASLVHRDEIGGTYYSPFQHHITIDGLEPNTTYFYVPVVGAREDGIENLRDKPLRDHPTQHIENWVAENKILQYNEIDGEDEDSGRRRIRRKLAPPPYDGTEQQCLEAHKVRSFHTAPVTSEGPVSFAIIGDLGQFDHSRDTLEHMKANQNEIDAVVLVGDIAYTGYDPKGWDTFFDSLDDWSIFSETPLQVATGNHDIEKQGDNNKIFQAYETRFRMPQVRPAELGEYEGDEVMENGELNMDAPPYPLPYEWGNGYYSFDYGPAKHIVINPYASMEPDSPQYKWFADVLESVDRSDTPWVLVTIHVPIYNTFSLHKHDPQIFAARENLEPLFVKYKVNIIFTGHIHAYQRTTNVAMEKLVPSAPIHITIGAGGRQCDAPFKSEEPEEWIVARDSSYFGYGRFTIYNQTHAHWRWIPLSVSDKHDYNFVNHEEDLHLPQLEHDQVVIENQFFMSSD